MCIALLTRVHVVKVLQLKDKSIVVGHVGDIISGMNNELLSCVSIAFDEGGVGGKKDSLVFDGQELKGSGWPLKMAERIMNYDSGEELAESLKSQGVSPDSKSWGKAFGGMSASGKKIKNNPEAVRILQSAVERMTSVSRHIIGPERVDMPHISTQRGATGPSLDGRGVIQTRNPGRKWEDGGFTQED